MTPELLARYQFAVKQRVVLSNRPTLVVTFKPKDGDLPERSVEDRILNRLTGTLWIDEAEADTARVRGEPGGFRHRGLVWLDGVADAV